MQPWRNGRKLGPAAAPSRVDRPDYGIVGDVGQVDGDRQRGQPADGPNVVRDGPDLRHRNPVHVHVTEPVHVPNPFALPITTTTPLPVGDLPGISSTISPTLSPGGNAGGLFPTLQPSSGSSATKNVKGRPVSDSTALPEGASVLGASLIGLAALALAFVLAVTRFSIRRRPAPTTPGSAAAADPAKPQDPTAAAAAGAAEAPTTQAADKAPSNGTPEPSQDTPKASEDATGTPNAAPEAPEDPSRPPSGQQPRYRRLPARPPLRAQFPTCRPPAVRPDQAARTRWRTCRWRSRPHLGSVAYAIHTTRRGRWRSRQLARS